MRILAKIFIVLTSLCLIALVVVHSMIQILSTPETVSDQLEKSGAYSVVADNLRTNIRSSFKAAQVEGPNVEQILTSSITPTSAKAVVRPTLIGLVDWLNSTSAPQPSLSLDLSNIKTSIVLSARHQGDVALGFVATREIPDTMNLGDKEKQPDLSGLKTNYAKLTGLQLPLAGATIVGIVLLMVFAFRNARHRLTWPAFSLFWAGVIGAGIMLALPTILSVTVLSSAKGSSDASPIILGIVRSLTQSTLGYFYGLLGVAVAILVVAYIFIRTPDKNKKRKGKK